MKLAASSKASDPLLVENQAVFDPLHLSSSPDQQTAPLSTLYHHSASLSTPTPTPFFFSPPILGLVASFALASFTQPAGATTSLIVASDEIPSAITSYGHYLGLFVFVASLTVERITVKADMTDDEEDMLKWADIAYGG
jgi:hypothetical protein